MARFTTRVELHGNAVGETYEQLHEAMARRGFTRTITNDSTGTTYRLPSAEYNLDANLTKEQVLELARTSATEVWTEFDVLVTKSAGRTWILRSG
jgi:hypothetical protein